jgi:hypothetical protein
MVFLKEYSNMAPFRERAEKAFSTPLGATSPLWLAFGAAATAGVGYWWLTQWSRALNVEAFMGLLAPTPAPVKAPPMLRVVAAEPTPTPAPGAAPASP